MNNSQYYVVTTVDNSTSSAPQTVLDACFNSSLVKSKNNTIINNSRMILANGVFYGCDAERNNWLMYKDNTKFDNVFWSWKKDLRKVAMLNSSTYITELRDYPDNRNSWQGINKSGFLVNDMPYCSIVETTSSSNSDLFYCSYDERWKPLESNVGSQLSFISWNLTNDQIKNEKNSYAGCCKINDCWNGTDCIANMAYTNDPPILTPVGGLRCVNGEWVNQSLQYNWNRKQEGYCAEKTQCLVEKDGNPYSTNNSEYYNLDPSQMPKCVNNGTYINDHYCDNGNWTSRAKLLAGFMLTLANDDYGLFCDDYKNLLPYLSEVLGSYMEDVFAYTQPDDDKTKVSMCVLKKFSITDNNDDIVLGIVNNPLIPINSSSEESKEGILLALGFNNNVCDNVINNNENKFYKCADFLYYNPRLDLVLYSKKFLNIGTNYLDMLNNLLHDPFKTIMQFITNQFEDWVQSSGSEIPNDFTIVNYTQDFNKMMIAKKGNAKIILVYERLAEGVDEETTDYIVARYSGFTPGEDLCKALNNTSPFSCLVDTNGNEYVARIKAEDDSFNKLFDAWNYLLGRTRLT